MRLALIRSPDLPGRWFCVDVVMMRRSVCVSFLGVGMESDCIGVRTCLVSVSRYCLVRMRNRCIDMIDGVYFRHVVNDPFLCRRSFAMSQTRDQTLWQQTTANAVRRLPMLLRQDVDVTTRAADIGVSASATAALDHHIDMVLRNIRMCLGVGVRYGSVSMRSSGVCMRFGICMRNRSIYMWHV